MPSCRTKRAGDKESSLDDLCCNDEAAEAGKSHMVREIIIRSRHHLSISKQQHLTVDFYVLCLIETIMDFVVPGPSSTNCTDRLIYCMLISKMCALCCILLKKCNVNQADYR